MTKLDHVINQRPEPRRSLSNLLSSANATPATGASTVSSFDLLLKQHRSAASLRDDRGNTPSPSATPPRARADAMSDRSAPSSERREIGERQPARALERPEPREPNRREGRAEHDEKRRTDNHRADNHRADSHPADNRPANHDPADNHRADSHPADNHPANKDATDNDPADKGRTVPEPDGTSDADRDRIEDRAELDENAPDQAALNQAAAMQHAAATSEPSVEQAAAGSSQALTVDAADSAVPLDTRGEESMVDMASRPGAERALAGRGNGEGEASDLVSGGPESGRLDQPGETAAMDLVGLDRTGVEPGSLGEGTPDLGSLDEASLDEASLDAARLDEASLDAASLDAASLEPGGTEDGMLETNQSVVASEDADRSDAELGAGSSGSAGDVEGADTTELTDTADATDAETGGTSMLDNSVGERLADRSGEENALTSNGSASNGSAPDSGDGRPSTGTVSEPVTADAAPETRDPVRNNPGGSSSDGARVDGAAGVPTRSPDSAAAAAPVTAPQSAEFDGEVWEQVRKAVSLVRQNGPGRHEVSLVLRPDDLGSIAVELIQSGDDVAVRIVTQTTAAQDRLDRGRLLAELQSAGIDPSAVDISHRDPSDAGADSGDGNTGGAAQRDSAGVGSDNAAPTRPIRRSPGLVGSTGGGLDLAL